MISIDFQGGMHGNYLEYICNRFLAGIDIQENIPFNSLGAAHQKTYLQPPLFKCDHFSTWPIEIPSTDIIAIKITAQDLLPVQCISLLRAGDYNIDPALLEKDTYNKLNNKSYRWMLDNIIQKYFQNQIVESYEAVMDPSWPMIGSKQEFLDLPEWIRRECLEQHGLFLHELSAANPDCPRYILREFFKIGFNEPHNHGFLDQQKKLQYPINKNVYEFPFSSFYDLEKFTHQISQISAWANLPNLSDENLSHVHQQFLSRQIYKDSKKRCDDFISQIELEETLQWPKFNVIEEAYIDSRLETIYKKTMPMNIDHWFESIEAIRKFTNNNDT